MKHAREYSGECDTSVPLKRKASVSQLPPSSLVDALFCTESISSGEVPDIRCVHMHTPNAECVMGNSRLSRNATKNKGAEREVPHTTCTRFIVESPEHTRGVARSFTNAVGLLGMYAVPNPLMFTDRYWTLMLDVKIWEIFVSQDDNVSQKIADYLGYDPVSILSGMREHQDTVSMYISKIFIDLPCYFFGRKFSVAAMILHEDSVARVIFSRLSKREKDMPYASVLRALMEINRVERKCTPILEMDSPRPNLLWKACTDLDKSQVADEYNELCLLRKLILIQRILLYATIARACFHEKLVERLDFIPEEECDAANLLGIDAWCKNVENRRALKMLIACDADNFEGESNSLQFVISRREDRNGSTGEINWGVFLDVVFVPSNTKDQFHSTRCNLNLIEDLIVPGMA